MKKYFVSYSYDKGFGNTEYSQHEAITESNELNTVEKLIEKDNNITGVVILNWRLFN